MATASVDVANKLLLTVPEACARAGIPRSRLYQEIAAGRCFSIKVGRSRRIPATALEDYVRRLIEEQVVC